MNRLLCCLLFIALSTEAVSAGVLERACTCRGYGEALNDLAGANNEALENCRAGGTGRSCTPPACPPGSIDITPLDSSGRSLLIRPMKDEMGKSLDNAIVAGSGAGSPSAGPCQRFPGSDTYGCSMAGEIIRQCSI